MQAYWIEFEPIAAFRFERERDIVVKKAVPSPFNLGMGVTARDEPDAVYLAKFVVGYSEIVSISLVHNVADLDQGHVRPNMGNIFVRGVWWPRGYEGTGRRAPGSNILLPFHAAIDVNDPEGVHKRVTVEACDLFDARAKLEAQYGAAVASIWIDQEFERPR